jgi:hypothetical protein
MTCDPRAAPCAQQESDVLIITPAGQTPPQLGQHLEEAAAERKLRKKSAPNWELDTTCTRLLRPACTLGP